MNNSVPERAYVNRKFERVFFLENQFCHTGEKCFVKASIWNAILHIIIILYTVVFL
jgi:hypothetical protein